MMDFIFKLVNSISLIIGICVGFITLRRWRAELFAKRRIELCEDILTKVFEARDAIREIRNAAIFHGEGSSRPRVEGESERQRQAGEAVYVYVERFEKRREPFDALNKMRYRFMALYGEEWGDPFQKFVATVNTVMIAAGQRIRDLQDEYYDDPQSAGARAAARASRDAILYRIGDQPDALDQEIDVAINQLSSKCKEEIKRESSLIYGLL